MSRHVAPPGRVVLKADAGAVAVAAATIVDVDIVVAVAEPARQRAAGRQDVRSAMRCRERARATAAGDTA